MVKATVKGMGVTVVGGTGEEGGEEEGMVEVVVVGGVGEAGTDQESGMAVHRAEMIMEVDMELRMTTVGLPLHKGVMTEGVGVVIAMVAHPLHYNHGILMRLLRPIICHHHQTNMIYPPVPSMIMVHRHPWM